MPFPSAFLRFSLLLLLLTSCADIPASLDGPSEVPITEVPTPEIPSETAPGEPEVPIDAIPPALPEPELKEADALLVPLRSSYNTRKAAENEPSLVLTGDGQTLVFDFDLRVPKNARINDARLALVSDGAYEGNSKIGIVLHSVVICDNYNASYASFIQLDWTNA